MLRPLVKAGADPCLRNGQRQMPLQILQQDGHHPEAATMAGLVEEALDAKRAAALLRLRRVMVKKQGVELSGESGMPAKEEQMLAYVVGLGEDDGCKRDMFTLLMDMLLPEWHPLRKGLGKAKGGEDSGTK